MEGSSYRYRFNLRRWKRYDTPDGYLTLSDSVCIFSEFLYMWIYGISIYKFEKFIIGLTY